LRQFAKSNGLSLNWIKPPLSARRGSHELPLGIICAEYGVFGLDVTGREGNVMNLYCYEIMDRSVIIMNNIEEYLINNPGIGKRQQKKLEKAIALIGEVYQWSGDEVAKSEKV
jgi:hypothetical protein